MNVYAYGTANRTDAMDMIVPKNEMVHTDFDYSFGAEHGVLLVAWPKEDQETNFKFDYWTDYYEESSSSMTTIIVSVVGAIGGVAGLTAIYKKGKAWYDKKKGNSVSPVEKLSLTENAVEPEKSNGPMDTIDPPSPRKATEGGEGLHTLENDNEMNELTSKPAQTDKPT